MSEANENKEYTWINPLGVWGAKGGNYEVTSNQVSDPSDVWRKNTGYKVPTAKVGRLKHYHIWDNHNEKLWKRLRWWPTRRHLLHVKGIYNRKTLNAEKKILDRRPIYWIICMVILFIGPVSYTHLTLPTIYSV